MDRYKIVEYHLWQCCINCQHYNPEFGTCNTYRKKPPCEVAVYGCTNWIESTPF